MDSFNKVDRLRAKSRELRTLSDPRSTQEQRHVALEPLDAKRRQRPDYAYRNDDNGMNFIPDQSRPSVEDDMNRRVTNKHGHEVYAPGYQEFSDVEVQPTPVSSVLLGMSPGSLGSGLKRVSE